MADATALIVDGDSTKSVCMRGLCVGVLGTLAVACVNPGGQPSRAFSKVVEASTTTGEGFSDPAKAINGVRGGGAMQGSTDVYSLDAAGGGVLVLEMVGDPIFDEPGDDVVVFENAFQYAGGNFMDPAIVSFSSDGLSWVEYPHRYLAEDPRRYSSNPDHWIGFAGIRPVLANVDTNAIDPFAEEAGGDRFDLSNLPEGEASQAIRNLGVRYIRIRSAYLEQNPDTQANYPKDPISDGPDIDAVYAR